LIQGIIATHGYGDVVADVRVSILIVFL